MDEFIKGTTIKIVDYNSWVIEKGQIIRYVARIHGEHYDNGEVYTLSKAMAELKERKVK